MEKASVRQTSEGRQAADFEVIVVGAGVSGLVAASTLIGQGARNILVIDEYAAVGGNHIDVAVGPFTFDVGSFIFQDDSPLLRHFPDLMPLYEPIDPSWARLNPQGVVTRYPFSLRDDVLAAGPLEILRIMASAIRARMDRRPMNNARDFARHWIGAHFLRRSGLENYMARFCGCPIDRIDLTFALSRMLWLPEQARLSSLARRLMTRVLRRSAPQGPTNRQLARPREGFHALYEPAVRRLEDQGVKFLLGQTLVSLRREGEEFRLVSSTHECQAPRVISTIPIGRITDVCERPLDQPLPSVTLLTLFYSFAGHRGFSESILYNFSYRADWKRLTVYSDLYGRAEDREYFAVEVICDEGDEGTASADAAATEFRQHTTDNGLFLGDLTLEGSHILSQAYPIYTGGSAERALVAVEALREMGIESFGRQGAFRYQPTARVSTLEAEAALRAM